MRKCAALLLLASIALTVIALVEYVNTLAAFSPHRNPWLIAVVVAIILVIVSTVLLFRATGQPADAQNNPDNPPSNREGANA